MNAGTEQIELPVEPAGFAMVDLDVVLSDALSNLSSLLDERGAEIQIGPLPVIRGDRKQIMLLLQNLIVNGIQFCRERPPKIEIKANREYGSWLVSVSDNGSGIEPRHYNTVLRLFQRPPTREEHPEKYTGLTICQHIMKNHGGSMEIESLTGQGTTFTLNFS